jgi:hypothetical protein
MFFDFTVFLKPSALIEELSLLLTSGELSAKF